MNQELVNVIKIYSTGSHVELSNYLIGKSKDTIIGIVNLHLEISTRAKEPSPCAFPFGTTYKVHLLCYGW
jgi:hypothetical protein